MATRESVIAMRTDLGQMLIASPCDVTATKYCVSPGSVMTGAASKRHDRAPAPDVMDKLEELDASCTGSGATLQRKVPATWPGPCRSRPARHHHRAQTRRGTGLAQADPGATAQRPPADALPRASRVRRTGTPAQPAAAPAWRAGTTSPPAVRTPTPSKATSWKRSADGSSRSTQTTTRRRDQIDARRYGPTSSCRRH